MIPVETNRTSSRTTRPGNRQGDQLRLTLGDLTNGGAAIAHTDEGQVVFVAFGAPGEEVVATIDRVQKDHLMAHVVEVIVPSRDRVLPLCPYFGACGGCNYQHLTYEAQLEAKRRIVIETLVRIGRLVDVPVQPTVPSPSPWFYRNQARLSCNQRGDVGFTQRSSNRILPIDICYIVEPPIRDLIPLLHGKGAGLHQIVVRSGVNTGDLMVVPDLTDRGVGVPSGQDSLTETVAGAQFFISPAAFFQVNTPQAENMVRLVGEQLRLGQEDILAEPVCGRWILQQDLCPAVPAGGCDRSLKTGSRRCRP